MSDRDHVPEGESLLDQAEAAARRRTLLVLVLFLGGAFGLMYFTAVSVGAARQELAEVKEAKRKALSRMQTALDSLQAVNADDEEREAALGRLHEQSVSLGSKQREQEEELKRLRRDYAKLLEATEKGRGSATAVSQMLETVERHRAAGEHEDARSWLDRVLALAPEDALAQQLDSELKAEGH